MSLANLVNVEDLKSGKLMDLVPEFYELKEVVENDGIWHDKQAVFDHTLRVMASMQKNFDLINDRTKKLLDERINGLTKKNLLEITGLLHDISKKETFKVVNGLTQCPNHWEEGAIKSIKILKRLGFSEDQIHFVSELIKNHMLIHNALWKDQNFKKIPEIKKDLKEDYPAQLLLAFADMMGCDMDKLRPDEFKSRVGSYQKEIENL